MVALETKYHTSCLIQLYNKARKPRTGESDLNNHEKTLHAYVLAELVMYSNRLNQLGVEIDGRVHTTRLKQRVLAHFLDMRVYTKGRETILVFNEYVGSSLMKVCEFDTGLMLYARTQKREIIEKLYSLGISISYDSALQLSTQLGEKFGGIHGTTTRHLASKHHSPKMFAHIINLGNPFEEEIMDLISIVTKKITGHQAVDVARKVKAVGLEQFKAFATEFFIHRMRCIDDTIHCNKINHGKQNNFTNGEGVQSALSMEALMSVAPCMHEEADSRMILHAQHAMQHDHKTICIRTKLIKTAGNELLLAHGTGKYFCYLAALKIAAGIGSDKSLALPLSHALTGYDTVSRKLPGPFASLPEDVFTCIERFVILLYDRTSFCLDVDEARTKLFIKKNNVQLITPTKAALKEHVRRATYQGSHVWASYYSEARASIAFSLGNQEKEHEVELRDLGEVWKMAAPECKGEGNGRPSRKPADQLYLTARFPKNVKNLLTS
ncbi:hypothetical protein PR048_005765 [Dryococelus australis]|uniref:Uncharacterized protein n=1 Tax=Dryococelus australis TaxID=614101 RepID=A0ABQ9I946_9NEOP|nr:hypothetical protein PR048_005765 [Dryococelus australis]